MLIRAKRQFGGIHDGEAQVCIAATEMHGCSSLHLALYDYSDPQMVLPGKGPFSSGQGDLMVWKWSKAHVLAQKCPKSDRLLARFMASPSTSGCSRSGRLRRPEQYYSDEHRRGPLLKQTRPAKDPNDHYTFSHLSPCHSDVDVLPRSKEEKKDAVSLSLGMTSPANHVMRHDLRRSHLPAEFDGRECVRSTKAPPTAQA